MRDTPPDPPPSAEDSYAIGAGACVRRGMRHLLDQLVSQSNGAVGYLEDKGFWASSFTVWGPRVHMNRLRRHLRTWEDRQ